MLKNLTHVHRPSTIEEACALLAAPDCKNIALAGGTYLAESSDTTIQGLVDLSGLDLNFIRETSEGYAIGAMTPVQDIFKSKLLKGATGHLLKAAAGRIGSTLLRHSITAGGNLVSVFPWSDLPPALLALDAEVQIRKGIPKRTVPVATLLEKTPREFLDKSELVTEIHVPAYGATTGTSFTKFAKTANDYSLITVAIRITVLQGLIRDVRIALSGCTKKPVRRPEAEALLKGQTPTPERLANAAARAAQNLDLTNDFRASKEYRSEILPVLIRRGIEDALRQIAA
ncbi:MAG: Xanthine dehydrogenase iron-sulfur subunit [Candidatus Ozemobacter sibiricus]|uniref:Xanthine dehydrogenase iron-sulfur subunit n=1 Tax=Candidatus Ozemobacter sibiricus TaxID=2268124 RepID=A0A367ZIW8_9BACT|nr:MAG: Xanthine dehydrogenase iron-sulfur subunit [Candidatus Ozemobacter sibiricus]